MKVLNATASHQLGLALLVSACAHVILLGWAWTPPEPGRSALSQRKGILTVLHINPRRAPATPPVTAPSPAPPPKPSSIKAKLPIKAPETVAPVERPAPPPPTVPDAAEAKALTETQPASPPPPPQTPPGSQFTSLFAPILSQPLGRGRWGAPPRPMPPPDPMQLRQQAWLALATDLKQRLASLPEAACDIRLDADSREGSVDCDTPENTARVWALLQGLLRPGSARLDGASAMCLQTSAGQTLVQTCPTDTNRTAP